MAPIVAIIIILLALGLWVGAYYIQSKHGTDPRPGEKVHIRSLFTFPNELSANHAYNDLKARGIKAVSKFDKAWNEWMVRSLQPDTYDPETFEASFDTEEAWAQQ